MNKSLMVVRLYDESVIWATGWKEEPGHFILEDTKCTHENEVPVYIEDEVMISNDAIRVWFRVLRGGKNEEDVQDEPYESETTPVG